MPPYILPKGAAPFAPIIINSLATTTEKPTASTSCFNVAKKAPLKKAAAYSAGCDLEKQLLAGSLSSFLKVQHPLAQVKYYKHLAASMCSKLIRTKYLYLQFFTFILSSEEKALTTLQQGGAPPNIETLKMFIRNAATEGRSGLELGLTGWSYSTAKNFISDMYTMVHIKNCI